MTRSHANKATFSPPFLHPPSPSTATNATPPTTDHMGRPGDMEGGTRWAYKVRPLFLFFIFYFTYFDSTPSSPNMFPSTENAPTRHSCRPQLTRDVPHPPNTSPRPEHQNVPLWARSGVPSSPPSFRTPESAHVGTFWCLRTSPLPLPCLEHQNVPTRARSGVRDVGTCRT